MMHDVFHAADTLSCVLQSADQTVAEGLEAVQFSLTQLSKLRTDQRFDTVCSHIHSTIANYELHDMKLPRHIQRYRLVTSTTPPARPTVLSQLKTSTVSTVQYFGFLDSVINHIGQRFEQGDNVQYLKMESLLIAVLKKEDFSLLLGDTVGFL
jgi:hypothetical protein